MKQRVRQLTALILALAMCLSLLSANVWASEIEPLEDGSVSAQSIEEVAVEEDSDPEASSTEENAEPENPAISESSGDDEQIAQVDFYPTSKEKEDTIAIEDEPDEEQSKAVIKHDSTNKHKELLQVQSDSGHSSVFLDACSIIDSDSYQNNMGDSFVDVIGCNENTRGNTDINGNSYQHGVEVWLARWNYEAEKSWAYATFALNGEYDTLTGDCVIIESYNTDNFDTTIYFYGDNTLIKSYRLTPSSLPSEITITTKGIKQLKIYAEDNKAVEGGTSIGLVNMLLKSQGSDTSDTSITGNCGRNILWTFEKNAGTLTISGTGKMYDYDDSSEIGGDKVPWNHYKYEIEKVIIKNGVTSIGTRAFLGCRNLTSITIPNSVTTIGGSAFGNCFKLKSIRIPESVTHIGIEAFDNCSGLTGITIPDSVISIGDGAFFDCSSLTSITIPKRVTNINSVTFSGCNKLSSITIPKSVNRISYAAFSGCKSLTSVTIPDSVTAIGSDTFYRCVNLTEIYFCGDAPKDFSTLAFSEVTATAYYPANNTTWTDAVKQNYGGTLTWVEWNPNYNPLTITDGPITLPVGRKAVIQASFHDSDGVLSEAPGGITWSSSHQDSDGKITITPISDYYEYCVCEITGQKVGTCTVTAKTGNGYSASVTINVVDPSEETKQTVSVSGKEEYLNGSQNYTLETNSNGSLNVKGPITSEVVIDNKSKYTTANNTLTVKNHGKLIVNGTLNAKKIVIKAGGELQVLGRVNAESVIAEGGTPIWLGGHLNVQGVLSAGEVKIKNHATCTNWGQIISENTFIYKSSEKADNFQGTLFVGGSLEIGKKFNPESAKLNTVFYGNTQESSFSFHKKCNIGNVYVKDKEQFASIDLPSENRSSVLKYSQLKKSETAMWTYQVTNEKIETAWEENLGAVYQNLIKERQTAALITYYPGLSDEDCKFVSALAELWANSISPNINLGLNKFSHSTYDMEFKLHNKSYLLRYNVDVYGSYANMGTIQFGTDENHLGSKIGLTATASITNFKAQVAAYLAEGYVKEYYKFVAGAIPKGATEATLKGKLKKGGISIAKKFFNKIVDKTVFSALSESTTPEYDRIKKTFKVTNLVLDDNLTGLLSLAFGEVKNSLFTQEAIDNDNGSSEKTQPYVTQRAIFNPILPDDLILDTHLKQALIEVVGEDKYGNPDYSNQEKVTFLDLSGKHIQTLNGLSKFTNLQTLIINDNEIENLSPLSQMHTLKYLNASGMMISDLTPLSGLSNLIYLDVSNNNIEDISPLASTTHLQTLNISDNAVSTLYPISSLNELISLDASSNEISDSDLSSLAGSPHLRSVNIASNQLQSINGINVDNLKSLDARSNNIASLVGIQKANNLEELITADNAISSLPNLSSCSALRTLDISGNLLFDLTGLSSAPSLSYLDLSACYLTDNDLAEIGRCSSVNILDLSYNLIYDLSTLCNLTGLDSIDITETDVDISDPNTLPSNKIDYISNGKIIDPSTYNHVHNYNDPVWDWSSDYKSATAKFICKDNDDTQVVEATIREKITPASSSSEGQTIYTATVTFQSKDYTDIKTINLPKTSETDEADSRPRPAPKAANAISGSNAFTKTANTNKAQSFKLGAKANGAPLSYKSNNKKVTVAQNGKVTIKKGFVGKAVITITAAETEQYLSAQKQVTVTVNPSVTQLSSMKYDKKKKTVIAAWKKNTTGKGYEVQYSTNKKFKKGVKTVKIKKNVTVKTTVKKLKKGTWYFRLRTVNGKHVSGWSNVKTLNIAK